LRAGWGRSESVVVGAVVAVSGFGEREDGRGGGSIVGLFWMGSSFSGQEDMKCRYCYCYCAEVIEKEAFVNAQGEKDKRQSSRLKLFSYR
jgi:hypothetical protein